MKHLYLLLLLLLAGCEQSLQPKSEEVASAQSPTAVSEKLDKLYADWNEEYLRLNPFSATHRGDHRFDDQWGPDGLSEAYQQQDQDMNSKFLQRLLAHDPERLNSQDRLSYELFLYQRKQTLDAYDQGFVEFGDLIPINQFFSTASYLVQLGSGGSAQPFKTTKDYDNWIARSHGFSGHVDLLIKHMDEGIGRGVVQPRILMERLLPQLAAQQVDKVEDSSFWKPVENMPEEFSEPERKRISANYAKHIKQVLIPAYARLHDYINNEYLPHTRNGVGLSDLPGGRDYYNYLVRKSTTTTLTAVEIHEIGKTEVARLYSEMERIREQVEFDGDMQAFFEYLRTSPKFYAQNSEELLDGYEQLHKRVAPELQHLFNIQPRSDYVIKEVEAFRAPSMAAAQYNSGTPDGSRPGIFYVNTYDLPSRPMYMMQAISLHEASPGHHFQISIAQEQDELPAFRRFGGFTAYSEGWGLYAESLGKELGLYQDTYQYFGSLVAEIWRANRLVVDTGIHALGWTRQQAIDWMLKYSPMVEQDVTAEVDRYIAIPSQALAYKIGQLKIRALRERSEQKLGDGFDIKAFHDLVLTTGSIPLSLLEDAIVRWLENTDSA